ncbi:MAG: hypothetical protein ACRYF3_15775 [Janthinobacterium lividum]
MLGTATIVSALLTPTLFVDAGSTSAVAWATTALTVLTAVAFVLRERSARHPLLDLALIARPLVASGLAYKAAAGLVLAGVSFLVTLQLQFAWGWSPTSAALGMLPQVLVLLAGGRLVGPFVAWVGLDRAAWFSASAVVSGLAVFTLFASSGYGWIVIALVLVAAGMRVVGVVAGNNVLRGLPANRTSVGAALVDTSSELATGIGITATGTVLAALFTGDITASTWSPVQSGQFQQAIEVAGLILCAVATALVTLGILRSRHGVSDQAPHEPAGALPAQTT